MLLFDARAAQTVAFAVFEIDRDRGLALGGLAAVAVQRQSGHLRLGVEHLQLCHVQHTLLVQGKRCILRRVRPAVVGDHLVAGDLQRVRRAGKCLCICAGGQLDVRRAAKVGIRLRAEIDMRCADRRLAGVRMNRQTAVLAIGAGRAEAQRIRAAQGSPDHGGLALHVDARLARKADAAAAVAVQRQMHHAKPRVEPHRPAVAGLIGLFVGDLNLLAVYRHRSVQRPDCGDIALKRIFRDRKCLAGLVPLNCAAVIPADHVTLPVCELQTRSGLRRRERQFSAGLRGQFAYPVYIIYYPKRHGSLRLPEGVELCAAGQTDLGVRQIRFPAERIRAVVMDDRPVGRSEVREVVGACCDDLFAV